MVCHEVSDPRDQVLVLLRAHALAADGVHELAMVRQIEAFVLAHADCAERTLPVGHLTGSAWIVNAARSQTLLTHHRKLDKWLQLGGHADGDLDLAAVALREAREESGLTRIRLVDSQLFDVDCHIIPARGAERAHVHYDLRFLVEAEEGEPLVMSHESKDLAWVELGEVPRLSTEESILRMVRKTQALAARG
jgi:8-oxo-dGTP pyrophosphatase MutT (NUDIX family)